MTRMNKEPFIYGELSYWVNAALYQTQNALGRYAREKHYGDALEKALVEQGIAYEREKILSRTGNDVNKADFVAEGKILIELKVKPFVTREDYYQVLRYLEAGNFLLGIIANFRQKYLRPKRIINPKFKNGPH